MYSSEIDLSALDRLVEIAKYHGLSADRQRINFEYSVGEEPLTELRFGCWGKTHGFARAQQQAALRQIRTNNNRLSFDANMVIVGREATQKDLKAFDIGLNWTPNRTRGRSTSGRSESSLSGFAGIRFTGQGVNIVASGSATITSPARTRHGGGVAGNYRLFNYSAPTPDNRTQRSNSLAPSRHSNFMATLPRRPLSAQERAASMREITNYLNSVRWNNGL